MDEKGTDDRGVAIEGLTKAQEFREIIMEMLSILKKDEKDWSVEDRAVMAALDERIIARRVADEVSVQAEQRVLRSQRRP